LLYTQIVFKYIPKFRSGFKNIKMVGWI